MPVFEKSTVIDVPLEFVFRYIADTTHLSEFWPNVVEVNDIQRLPNGGRKFEWMYKMAGVQLEGTSETFDFNPYQRIANVLKGGFRGFMSWVFDREDDNSTRITVYFDYRVPPPLLKKHSESYIAEQNEKDMDATLRNLKVVMESHLAVKP